jgi:hypothetical protein
MVETNAPKLLIYQYYRHVPDTGKTVNAGYNYHEFSSSSISAYAKKIGVDYRFIDHEIPISPFYGIFLPFTEGWCHDYDAVCFIDSDILATVHSPNIFDYSSKELISIHLMSNARPRGKNLSDVDYFMKNGIFNSGVVIFPRATYDSLIEHTKNLNEYHRSLNETHNSIGSLDQAFINFYIRDVVKTYHNLDKKFNYNLSRNSLGTRFLNNFIHYHRLFKRNIKDDYYDGSIIKGPSINLKDNEIYQPKASISTYRDVYKDPKEYWNQRILDHKMLRQSFGNKNVLIRTYTNPYIVHTLFEESKASDILRGKYEFTDYVDQETANSFYEKFITPIIKDKISMYYESRPASRKLPDKFVLVALYDDVIENNLQRASYYEENINMAKYGKLIANSLGIHLIIKTHPLLKNKDSFNLVGYLSQDNFKIVGNDITDLIDGADVVLTSRSRIGLESIMRLKKTIIFDDQLSYKHVCHKFKDTNCAVDYILKEDLPIDFIKRYLFSYFTDFLKIEISKH